MTNPDPEQPKEPIPGIPPGLNLPPGMLPPGMGDAPGGPPPGMPGGPPPGAGAPPGGGEPKIETFTHHDTEKDVFHCSYGPLAAGRTIWDPERGIQVRLDQHSQRVIGFSIPEFSKWHAEHADEDGAFEMDLPDFWPEAPAPGSDS